MSITFDTSLNTQLSAISAYAVSPMTPTLSTYCLNIGAYDPYKYSPTPPETGTWDPMDTNSTFSSSPELSTINTDYTNEQLLFTANVDATLDPELSGSLMTEWSVSKPTNTNVIVVKTENGHAYDGLSAKDYGGSGSITPTVDTLTTNHASPSGVITTEEPGMYTITLSAWDTADKTNTIVSTDVKCLCRHSLPQSKMIAPASVLSGQDTLIFNASEPTDRAKAGGHNLTTFNWSITGGNNASINGGETTATTEDITLKIDSVGETYTLMLTAQDDIMVNNPWLMQDEIPISLRPAQTIDHDVRTFTSASIVTVEPGANQIWPGNTAQSNTDLSASEIDAFGGKAMYKLGVDRPTAPSTGSTTSVNSWQPIAGSSNMSWRGAQQEWCETTGGQGAKVYINSDAQGYIFAPSNATTAGVRWTAPYKGTVRLVFTGVDAYPDSSVLHNGCNITITGPDGEVLNQDISHANSSIVSDDKIFSVDTGENVEIKVSAKGSTATNDEVLVEAEFLYVNNPDTNKPELPAGAKSNISLSESIKRTSKTRMTPGKDRAANDTFTQNLSVSEVVGAHIRPRVTFTRINLDPTPSWTQGSGSVAYKVIGKGGAVWTKLKGGRGNVDHGWQLIPNGISTYTNLTGGHSSSKPADAYDYYILAKEYVEMEDGTTQGIISEPYNTNCKIDIDGVYYV